MMLNEAASVLKSAPNTTTKHRKPANRWSNVLVLKALCNDDVPETNYVVFTWIDAFATYNGANGVPRNHFIVTSTLNLCLAPNSVSLKLFLARRAPH